MGILIMLTLLFGMAWLGVFALGVFLAVLTEPKDKKKR